MGNGPSLGKVRGLGSSKEGAHHWLVQRFTAIGNLVAGLFIGASFIFLPDLSYESVVGWLSSPLAAVVVALFVISTFWHARLGLQVLIEDYVQDDGNKFAALAALNIAAFAGVAAGLFFLITIVTGANSEAAADAAAQEAITELMQGMAAGAAGQPGGAVQ